MPVNWEKCKFEGVVRKKWASKVRKEKKQSEYQLEYGCIWAYEYMLAYIHVCTLPNTHIL